MKRFCLIVALAVSCCVLSQPTQSEACEHLGHRLRAVTRVSLRVATAPVRLVRKIRQRRCCCCLTHAATQSATASQCGTGPCPAE